LFYQTLLPYFARWTKPGSNRKNLTGSPKKIRAFINWLGQHHKITDKNLSGFIYPLPNLITLITNMEKQLPYYLILQGEQNQVQAEKT